MFFSTKKVQKNSPKVDIVGFKISRTIKKLHVIRALVQTR